MIPLLKPEYRRGHWDYEAILIALVLGGSSLVMHPYLSLFIATIAQVYLRVNSLAFFCIFIPSISLFWAGRNLCFIYDTGIDDACHYSDTFYRINLEGIANILDLGTADYFGNEPGFMLLHHIAWLFSNNFNTFIFFTHILTLSLISLGFFSIEKRSSIIMFGLLFFGVGNFAEQSGMHLLRSTLAGAFLFSAVSAYPNKKRLCSILLFLSASIHFSVIPLVLIFLAILIYLRCKNSPSKLILIFIISILIMGIILFNFLPNNSLESRYMYIDIDRSVHISVLNILAILSLFFVGFKNTMAIGYGMVTISILSFIELISPDLSFITGRYLAMLLPFAAVLLFLLIKKFIISRLLIMIFIALLATYKAYILNNSSFINKAFPDFINPFLGSININ